MKGRIFYFLGTIAILLASIYLLLRTDQIEQSQLAQVEVKVLTNEVCVNVLDALGEKVVTNEEKEDALQISNLIRYTNPNYEVEYSLNTQEFSETQETLIITAIPFAIVLLIAIFTFITLFICCACDPCCPTCKKCRRDVTTQPYTNGELHIPMVFLGFLFVLIVGASLAGLIYSDELEESVKTMRCAVLASGNDILYDDFWAGLNLIHERIGATNEQLDYFVDKTMESMKALNPGGIQEDYDEILILNEEIRIDVSYTYDADGLKVKYDSFFTSNNFLGFLSEEDAVDNQFIRDEIEANELAPQKQLFDTAYPKIIQSIQDVKDSGDNIANDANQFKSNLKDAQSDVNQLKIDVTTQMNDFYSQSNQIQDISKYITWGQYAYYGFSIFLCILASFAMLLLLKSVYCARFCVHFVWCFYGLFMIIGFILTFVLYPTTGILVEICDYSQKILTIQDALEQQQFLDGNQKKLLVECLFSEGDVLKTFGIDKQIEDVKEIEESLLKFNEDATEFQESMKITNEKLAINEEYLKKFSLNDQVDSDPQGNIIQTMKNFKKDDSGCKQDKFVTSQSDCDSSTTFWKQNDADSSIQTDYMCFHANIMSTDYINDRYKDCDDQSRTYSNLKNFFEEQNESWDVVNQKEQYVIDKNEKTIASTNAQIDTIKYYDQQTANYINKITNKQTGVVAGINCTFLGTTFNRFYDSICVKTVPPLFKTQLFVFIISVSMYFGAIAGYCIGMRHSKHEEGEQAKKQNQNIQNEQREQQKQVKYINPNFTGTNVGQIQADENQDQPPQPQ